MAVTSNINQANFQSQTRALNEQQAQETQRASQQFAATESQKTRDFTERQYELKAGDKFVDDNVIQTFDDTQLSTMGEVTAVVYSEAQERILAATKKIKSGDGKTRIEGQTELTEANNSLKQLAQDLMIAEADTEEAAAGNNIPGPNNDVVQDINRSNVEGLTRVVSSEKAERAEGDKNTGRYIKYKNKAGEEQYISMDSYRKILNGLIPRQDVNAWVKATSANLEQSQTLDSKFLEREATVEHVKNYLSDPKILKALQHQMGDVTPEQVQTNLENMLIDSKGTQAIERADRSIGRTPTFSDEIKMRDFSQRHYDIQQGFQIDDPVASAQAIFKKVNNKATRSGPEKWNGKEITNVEIADGVIRLTYDSSSKVRELPWTQDQLNSLYNEIRYSSTSEGKISTASALSTAPNNWTAADKARATKVDEIDPQITNMVKALKGKNGTGGVKVAAAIISGLKNMPEYARLMNKDMLGKPGFFSAILDGNNIQLNGVDYNIESEAGIDRFLVDLDKIVKEARGEKATQATQQRGTNRIP